MFSWLLATGPEDEEEKQPMRLQGPLTQLEWFDQGESELRSKEIQAERALWEANDLEQRHRSMCEAIAVDRFVSEQRQAEALRTLCSAQQHAALQEEALARVVLEEDELRARILVARFREDAAAERCCEATLHNSEAQRLRAEATELFAVAERLEQRAVALSEELERRDVTLREWHNLLECREAALQESTREADVQRNALLQRSEELDVRCAAVEAESRRVAELREKTHAEAAELEIERARLEELRSALVQREQLVSTCTALLGRKETQIAERQRQLEALNSQLAFEIQRNLICNGLKRGHWDSPVLTVLELASRKSVGQVLQRRPHGIAGLTSNS
eukprot:TRINITY_DN54216_c0_g1_i1.p1 TRINITY_DN54216_c0_g1~~TRINITY_DN54216_c0_g1_i1.p1  ORF type:complete len:336 (+),score=61.23 TRINITY_DN54216_c0_g1_i1:21-1028(+)